MPRIQCGNIGLYYEVQGTGEPVILIPYTSADHACYAFQVGEYAKHFTCFSLDLRGTGESDKPGEAYTTETLADDVAGFMQAANIPKAHVMGLSLGAAVGLWLAAKHPDKVLSLGVHSGWPKTDGFIRAVLEGWQKAAKGIQNMPDVVIQVIFPWCLTPETYAGKPELVKSLADFVRSRPAQSVDSFLQQTNAALSHDATEQLKRISAPTQITFGARDALTSTRFADALGMIPNSELLVFDGCSHATIYEKVEEFNQRTLQFLQGHGAQNRHQASSSSG